MTDDPESRLAAWSKPYVAAFGEVPPIPLERLRQAAADGDAFTEGFEALRERALHSDVIDDRWSQIIAFAILVNSGAVEASRWHARAALRAGAGLAELRKAIEIAAVINAGLSALNTGALALRDLPGSEEA